MASRWRSAVCAAVLSGLAATGTMLSLCPSWRGQWSTDALGHDEALEILFGDPADPRIPAAILVLHLDAALYAEKLKALATGETIHADRARAFLDDLKRRAEQ